MSINFILNISKKFFTRVPKINFLGNRNKLHLEQKHKHNNEIKLEHTDIDKNFANSKPVSETPITKGSPSFSLFIKEFNNIKQDYDIKRQALSEEEIKIINFQDIKINDWSKIKLN